MTLRSDLVAVLQQVHFDLPIKVLIGEMDEPYWYSSFLGYSVAAYSRYVHSINIDDLRDDFATEIGKDILAMHRNKTGTRYAIYFYQVPRFDNNYSISYAKASAW
jgi:hypothetical protein